VTSLPGFKELLVGDSGTGKTHAVRSLLGTGVQPILLATEPGFRSLAPCDNPACSICGPLNSENRKAPPIPYAYIAPNGGSIDIQIEMANNIATKNQSQLANISDSKRKDDFAQFVRVLEWLKTPVDMKGVTYGPVTSWANDRCLVLDGVSSLGDMAMDLFAGRRPLYDKPDYQVAQRAIKQLMVFLTMQVSCPVIVIAHVGRGEDSLEGRNKITVNTVGQKLAPELPRMFDDMIHAEREGTNFTWSTATSGAIAKGRNIPIKAGMRPDFGVIVTSWKKAGGMIVPSETK
jgi:hypothetical protein